MATIEVSDAVLEEVKALAKQFLDKSKKDVNYADTQELELLIIGDRITEALFPTEFREHMQRLAEAVDTPDPYVVVFGRRDQEGGERKVTFNAENRDKAFGFAVRMSADEKWGIKEIREKGVDVTKEFDAYFERNFG